MNQLPQQKRSLMGHLVQKKMRFFSLSLVSIITMNLKCNIHCLRIYRYKKGSIVIREKRDLIIKRLKEKPDTISTSLTIEALEAMSPETVQTVVLHCDIIRDKPFWEDHPDLLD